MTASLDAVVAEADGPAPDPIVDWAGRRTLETSEWLSPRCLRSGGGHPRWSRRRVTIIEVVAPARAEHFVT